MTSIFRPNRPIPPEEISSEAQPPIQEGPSIFSFKSPKQEQIKTPIIQQETPGEENRRAAARWAARGAETVLGFVPGMVESGVRGANYLAKKVPGSGIPEEDLESAFKYNPTPSRIRKWHEAFTGEYLKPQSESEALWDEGVEDVVGMLIPLPGEKKATTAIKWADKIKNFGKKLFKTGTAETVALGTKEGAKLLGADEENAQWLKMGTLFASQLMMKNGLRGAEKYKNSLYKEAKGLRPQNAFVNARNFDREIRGLQRNLQRGTTNVASKTKTLQILKDMRAKISRRGTISIDELEEFKRNINESRAHLYEEFKVDKVGRKMAKRNLDSASQLVDKSLEEYGKRNATWYKKYSEANNAHAAIEQSKKASRFIEKNVKPILGGTGATALVEAFTGHPGAIIPTLAGAAAATVTVKGAELIARIMKSPELRKYYLSVLEAAAKENTVVMNHNFRKLQEELEKENKD